MPTYSDLLGPLADRLQGTQEAAAFACVAVRGPDAVAFVQRLCSQDVAGLAAGRAAPGAFLTAKGKVETLVWLARGDGVVWIEAQRHELTKLAELLERYHFSERLSVEPMVDWSCRQVVGPKAWEAVGVAERSAGLDPAALFFAGECRGLRWVRFHGAPASLPAARGSALDDADWELLRIAAGVPKMAVDVDGATLAPEADIDDHLSTSKGCYTGQEIVARIHTYGHTNRRLCRLKLMPATGGPLPPPPSPGGPMLAIVDGEGSRVGRVTSLAGLPNTPGALALGYLPHELVQAGSRLALDGGGTVEVV